MKNRLSNSERERPFISIITVTFNPGKKFEQTILSVIAQSYTNIEYLVIDGGSTDGTTEIVQKYRDRIAYFVSEPDNGIYDAMNKGIEAASGSWIYFLGAGDILYDILDKVAPQLKSRKHIYYGNVFYSDTQQIYDGKFSGFKLAVNNICHQAVFYPDDVLSTYKFNTKYKLLADHDLNMRCYGNQNISFKYIPQVICIYEGGGASASAPDKEFFKDKIRIIRKNFPFHVYLYAYARRALAMTIKGRRY